ncbi:MAG: malonyl CoA-acyl carrier protein transacylase, partial [Gammaproteobacteria bacterium]
QKAADQFAERLNTVNFEQAIIPVLHNVDATERSDVSKIKLALQDQLCQPVRWVETIQKMLSNDVSTIVECGPGKVLSGLIKRIDRSLNIFPVFDPASLEKALAEVTA